MAVLIEYWVSVTGVSPGDFFLLAALPDTGGAVVFDHTPVVPGGLYIYKARRRFGSVYSDFSPLVYAEGPWPTQGAELMGTPATGIQSRIGIGVEATEGQPVKAQNLIDRKSGGLKIDLSTLPHEVLRNITTDIDSVPGIAKVNGSITMTPTGEGVSRLLESLAGAPTTAAGGGTAPAAPTATPSLTGGTLPNATQYYFKVAYERADWGWTTASSEFSATTGAGTGVNSISVASPATQTGATGWRLYAGTATGVEVLIASGLAIGTPYVFTDPTLITANAGGYVPAVAFNVHTYKDSTTQSPVTITEKNGSSYFAYPGCRASGLSWNIDKTQNTPLEFVWDYEGLNKLVYGAESAIGTDTAPIDPLAAFGATGVTVTVGGTQSDARTISGKWGKNVLPKDVLDGYRGAQSHYVGKSTITGKMDLYFEDEVQMKTYFGQLAGVVAPYGAKKVVNTTPVVITIAGPVNANGFRNKIIITLPKVAFTMQDQPIQGPDAIMQTVEFTAYHDTVSGTPIQIDVWNTELNATLIGAGTPISAVPSNDVTSYSL